MMMNWRNQWGIWLNQWRILMMMMGMMSIGILLMCKILNRWDASSTIVSTWCCVFIFKTIRSRSSESMGPSVPNAFDLLTSPDSSILLKSLICHFQILSSPVILQLISIPYFREDIFKDISFIHIFLFGVNICEKLLDICQLCFKDFWIFLFK